MFWLIVLVLLAWIVLGSLKAVAGVLFWIVVVVLLLAALERGVALLRGRGDRRL